MAPSGYGYYKNITIDHTKVSSDLSYFPVLVSISGDTNLGARCRTDGYDVVFYSSDGSTAYKFERESFSISGGSCTALFWVQVPAVSSVSDTVIRMYYSNSSQTTDPQTTNGGTWDDGGSNYFKGVWHLGNGTTLSATDSIASGHNGTITGATAVAGKVDGGANFVGSSSQRISIGNYCNIGTNNFTISVWAKPPNTSSANSLIAKLLPSSPYTQYCFMHGHVDGSGNNTAGKHFGIYIHNGDSEGASYSQSVYTTSDTIDGNWHLVHFVRSGTTLYIYVDGSSKALTTVYNTTAINPDNSRNLYFAYDDAGTYHTGVLDELRIAIGVVRSAAWIGAEYANQNSPGTFYTLGSETAASSTTVLEVSSTATTEISATAAIYKHKFVSSTATATASANTTANLKKFISSLAAIEGNSLSHTTLYKLINSSAAISLNAVANTYLRKYITSSSSLSLNSASNLFLHRYVQSSAGMAISSLAEIYLQTNNFSILSTIELGATANVSVHKYISSTAEQSITAESRATLYKPVSSIATATLTANAAANLKKFISSLAAIEGNSLSHTTLYKVINSSAAISLNAVANTNLRKYITSLSSLSLNSISEIYKYTSDLSILSTIELGAIANVSVHKYISSTAEQSITAASKATLYKPVSSLATATLSATAAANLIKYISSLAAIQSSATSNVFKHCFVNSTGQITLTVLATVSGGAPKITDLAYPLLATLVINNKEVIIIQNNRTVTLK